SAAWRTRSRRPCAPDRPPRDERTSAPAGPRERSPARALGPVRAPGPLVRAGPVGALALRVVVGDPRRWPARPARHPGGHRVGTRAGPAREGAAGTAAVVRPDLQQRDSSGARSGVPRRGRARAGAAPTRSPSGARPDRLRPARPGAGSRLARLAGRAAHARDGGAARDRRGLCLARVLRASTRSLSLAARAGPRRDP